MLHDFSQRVELHTRKATGSGTYTPCRDTGLTLAQAIRRAMDFPEYRADREFVSVRCEGRVLAYAELVELYRGPDFPRG